jgi:transcriptional regulator with XRE-family HTH domain
MLSKTCGEEIRHLRITKNLSQETLAKLLNVHREEICRWENRGVNPTLRSLAKLRVIIGLDVNKIIDSHGK